MPIKQQARETVEILVLVPFFSVGRSSAVPFVRFKWRKSQTTLHIILILLEALLFNVAAKYSHSFLTTSRCGWNDYCSLADRRLCTLMIHINESNFLLSQVPSKNIIWPDIGTRQLCKYSKMEKNRYSHRVKGNHSNRKKQANDADPSEAVSVLLMIQKGGRCFQGIRM